MSHTTVNTTLAGARLSGWPVVERIVRALGGNTAHFGKLWRDASLEADDSLPDAPLNSPRLPGTATELAILSELTAIRSLLERILEGTTR